MNATFLQFESAGTRIKSLAPIGTLPGVELLDVAAANGPGVGTLFAMAEGIAWQAPGSATPGPAITPAADVDLIAVDGENADRWVRFRCLPDLVSSADSELVFLADQFNNPLAGADVTSAHAISGEVVTSTIKLHNVSGVTVHAIRVLFAAGSLSGGLGFDIPEVSPDGVTWSAPTPLTGGIAAGDLAAGASLWLHLRRTVPAGISPRASLAIEIVAAWTIDAVDYSVGVRGLWRIFGPACYRLYASRGMPPAPGSPPWRTSTSLPAMVDAVLPDGLWYFAMSYFNGVLDSGFLAIGPNGAMYLTRAVGSAALPAPQPFQTFTVDPPAAGNLLARGTYWEDGAYRAGQWAVQYQISGVTTELNGDLAAAMLAIVEASVPATPGQTIRVRGAVRRNDSLDEDPLWVYSAWTAWLTLTIPAAPSAPRRADEFPGVLAPSP